MGRELKLPNRINSNKKVTDHFLTRTFGSLTSFVGCSDLTCGNPLGGIRLLLSYVGQKFDTLFLGLVQ